MVEAAWASSAGSVDVLSPHRSEPRKDSLKHSVKVAAGHLSPPAVWLPLGTATPRDRCQVWDSVSLVALFPQPPRKHKTRTCVLDLNCSQAHLSQLKSEYIKRNNFLYVN